MFRAGRKPPEDAAPVSPEAHGLRARFGDYSLAIILGFAIALSGCASVPEPAAEQPAESPAPQQTPEVAPPTPPITRELTIAAVGDMMLGTDYPENHLPDDDGVGFLEGVAPVLSAADLTFGNLEGVLVDGGTPRKVCTNPSACFLFRTPSRYVRYFVDAGFDVLSLANNHSRDFGESGRSATMRTLDAAGIAHSGREGDFASMEVEGLKIAVLAFAVTQESNLLHDYERAAETVLAHDATHDIVIVSFHGGAEGNDVTRLPFAEEEYYGEPRGDVVYFARKMVDAGADLVLGHGPHVVRAMERYQDRIIAYSLGNFATYYGISVNGLNGVAPILQVTVDGTGRFIEGQIYSTVQVRPGGPQRDGSRHALHLIRSLSRQDFVTPGIRFLDNGRILPEARSTFREHLRTPSSTEHARSPVGRAPTGCCPRSLAPLWLRPL
jgi:poly-gamma-glutamate capsule biosynthesis protein CapA/YwtB (metallophosphatase superfamily)